MGREKSHPHCNQTSLRISCCSMPRSIIREEFSQIPGTSVGSLQCPSNSLLFYPTGYRDTAGWTRSPICKPAWAVRVPALNAGIVGKGQLRARGASSPPHLPVVRAPRTTLLLLPERLQYTRHMCVPKDRRSRMSRWGTFFFFSSFYSCPRNQHMIWKPTKLTHRSQHCLEETVLFLN